MLNYILLWMVLMNLTFGFTVTSSNLLHRHSNSITTTGSKSTSRTTGVPTAAKTDWNSLSNKKKSASLLALPSSLALMEMLPSDFLESSSLLQAVEVFDGSTITDSVVVSSVFWSSLKTKILSVIIGQFLASVVFGILAYLLSSQLDNLSDYLSKNVFQQTVIKKNVDEFTQTMKNKAQSPTVAPDYGKLILCLTIDVIGTSSELIPFVGELTDIAYAPVAALALRSLFQGSNVVFALEFIEEILPFTDILPLATICWVVETYYGDSDIAKTLQIGLYNNSNSINDNDNGSAYYEEKGNMDDEVIDTKIVQSQNNSKNRSLNEKRDRE